MPGLHMPELIIVLVVALLIFGPKKLPEMGSAIGKSIKEFRKGINEISTPKNNEVDAPKDALEENRLPLTTRTKAEYASSLSASEEVAAEHANE
jgi:sec-independent protein translocase protein TatA